LPVFKRLAKTKLSNHQRGREKMKKMVFALIALMAMTTAAQADSCTAVLEKSEYGYNYMIQTFTNYDYWDRQDACEESMRECRREMRERRRYDSRANYACNIQGRRGNDRGQCSFELVTRNGRTLQSFNRRACQAAKDACNRERVRRNRNGQNLRAQCIKVGRTTPPSRQVTKSCSVDRMGRRGVVETHFAQATGRRGTGVKAEACRKAMRKCERNTVRRQYCIERF
jgi:hypothetical protein